MSRLQTEKRRSSLGSWVFFHDLQTWHQTTTQAPVTVCYSTLVPFFLSSLTQHPGSSPPPESKAMQTLTFPYLMYLHKLMGTLVLVLQNEPRTEAVQCSVYSLQAQGIFASHFWDFSRSHPPGPRAHARVCKSNYTPTIRHNTWHRFKPSEIIGMYVGSIQRFSPAVRHC